MLKNITLGERGSKMLKIRENVDLKELEKFGFFSDFEYQTSYSEDFEFENQVIYEMGHSRRGQFYFILIDKSSLVMSVYATEPDGSGSNIAMSDVIFDLIQAGLVEKNND